MIKKLLKTKVLCFGFFVFGVLLFVGCSEPLKLTARQIVEKSIETHGGLETWQNATILSFTKTTILFNKDGSIEKEINQKQSFELKPQLKGFIQDLNYPGIVGIDFDGDNFWKKENDSIRKITDTTELETARNRFFSAQYVVSQPFALIEDNTILKLKGKEELDGKQVYAIDISYTSDNESSSDKWTYYFDIKTYQLLANKVIHKPTASLIKNLDFNTGTGLMFNAHRKSYFLKASGDIDYLRAEYFYKDFKVVY